MKGSKAQADIDETENKCFYRKNPKDYYSGLAKKKMPLFPAPLPTLFLTPLNLFFKMISASV